MVEFLATYERIMVSWFVLKCQNWKVRQYQDVIPKYCDYLRCLVLKLLWVQFYAFLSQLFDNSKVLCLYLGQHISFRQSTNSVDETPFPSIDVGV